MTVCFIYAGDISQRSADPLFHLKTISALVRIGHEVTLVIPRENGFVRDQFARTLQDFSIFEQFKVVRSPRPTFFGRGRRSFPLLAAAWAKTKGFDLVWSRDVYAADAASALRLNVIAEHHTVLSRRQLAATKRMVSRPEFKAFVANSQRHKRLLEDEGICGDKIIDAHGAVDLSQFENLDKSAGERTRNELCKTVVYAGSLYPGRGIEQMLEAAAVLKNVNFICVGGREFEVAQHKNHAQSKRLTNVSFVGYVPNKEVPSYLTSADILVAPYTNKCEAIDGTLSIDYASPMKLFEYMAAGKPIIASGIGAICEVLQHEQNALLVQQGSVDDIVYSIKRLLSDPHLAVKLGQAARENAKTYSWELRCSRILRFAHARKHD